MRIIIYVKKTKQMKLANFSNANKCKLNVNILLYLQNETVDKLRQETDRIYLTTLFVT